ncbi:TetR/AcrR family transcriptional regulator [Klebsiella sp. BIGb0407]|uniref:TetR/AcrR family transcriptional regulator n=1 Tax=Klebsiella sp. BIGb0407 TaxID=2940603 RepID=UPI0021695702|nr:TetR/AcrR family transcriptional regulator [Klebsiella sp. BIGb0407]MCS3429548.1 AcrR family transcriptional regulator [Klebsiella sp. BIGb0407]
MTNKHTRKKQPALVRASLIECTRILAARDSLSTTSVQAICDMAGVTKGAFFHHFPSKEAMLSCVYAQMLEEYSTQITHLMETDPFQTGAFTRAYLELAISTINNPEMVTLWKSAMTDTQVCQYWRDWYLTILEERKEFEERPEFEIVRLAADGLCMGVTMDIFPLDLAGVISALRRLSAAPDAQ